MYLRFTYILLAGDQTFKLKKKDQYLHVNIRRA